MPRRRFSNRRVRADMNVVPYIDVMLVLLVIFMIATPLIQRSVEVNLPQVDEQHSSSQTDTGDLTLPLILTVDSQGNFYLNISATPHTPLAVKQIQHEATLYLQKHPQIDVYVSGDAHVDYAKVVEGLGYLRIAGAQQVNLSSQLPQGEQRNGNQ